MSDGRQDPNVAIVTLVAHALGPLKDQFVLVGGCCVGLLITDAGRPPVRATIDVDLIAEVTSLAAYYEDLRPKLMGLGFHESPDADHMCRWHLGSLVLDVLPADESIFGHSTNKWYPEAVESARVMKLEGAMTMRVVAAPVFVATKLEAFGDRGKGDYMQQDMEDIINLVAGRPELPEEVEQWGSEVQDYLRASFDDLLSDQRFLDSLEWHLAHESGAEKRIAVVLERLRRMAGL
ncbi:hypothetical protein [Variovorax boronicumulans]